MNYRQRRVAITLDLLREVLHFPEDCKLELIKQQPDDKAILVFCSDKFDEVPPDGEVPLYYPTYKTDFVKRIDFVEWGDPIPDP